MKIIEIEKKKNKESVFPNFHLILVICIYNHKQKKICNCTRHIETQQDINYFLTWPQSIAGCLEYFLMYCYVITLSDTQLRLVTYKNIDC